MIVYNVERRWFTMKNYAEAYRRELSLPPSATFKLSIDDREDLAGLLNGLCGIEKQGPAFGWVFDPVAPPEVVDRNEVHDPDGIPRFLRESWQKFHERAGL
ncbi:MAG: hypothetical protein ACTHJ3_00655 [Pararhizobium sp.]